jgi:hypothetical protein
MCKKAELIQLIKSAINKQNDLLVDIADSDNPQLKTLAAKTSGSKNALSDVLSALMGNDVYLRILAGK